MSSPSSIRLATARLSAFAPPKLDSRVLLALFAVYVIWSSTYLVLRFMVSDMPAMSTSGVRFVLAGALLFGFLRFRGAAAPTLVQWRNAAICGVLMFLVGNGFVAIAAKHVPSGVTAMSVGSMPLFFAAMEALLGKRLPTRQWIGLGLGFVGVATMGVADARATPMAALLLLLAPLGWAAGSLAVKRLDLPQGAMAGAAQMLCAGAVMLGIGLAAGERFTHMPSAHALLAFAYLVIFGSIIGFSACMYLLRETSGPLATSYAYVNPILAAALGAFAADERLQPEFVLAGALVVGGVAILVTSGSRDRRQEQAREVTPMMDGVAERV